MNTERTGRAYAQVAPLYIDLLGHIDAVDVADRRFITRAFAGVTGRIVDAGCGPGHITAMLHELGHDAHGVDVVPDFVAHARRTYPQVTYTLGRIEQLEHDDESFAGALAWYSLIHFPPADFDGALRELHRVLARGGVLALGLFHGNTQYEFAHKVTPATAWPQSELSRRLTCAGFTPREWTHRPATEHQREHLAVIAVRD